MSSNPPAFRFIDLFAGVGGFHAAMKAYGGECVYAVEIDKQAAEVYELNWGHPALGDITKDAYEDENKKVVMNVPEHDVLCAGFPCQPFSKSGAQRGMDEARGTLFFNIALIIKTHHPKVVLLENVRNLIGPRHQHEWEVIIETLRDEGYHVSDEATVFSPHLLPPYLGGTPQVRERVFITATHAPELVGQDLAIGGPAPAALMVDRFPVAPGAKEHFDPKNDWDLGEILDDADNVEGCSLNPSEWHWINAWNTFVKMMRPLMGGRHLPGHPIWADAWMDFREMQAIDWDSGEMPKLPRKVVVPEVDETLPDWKQSHLRKNYDMFERHFRSIIPWAYEYGIYTSKFPTSRRKLEWQAQETGSLWETVMHLRPSGIRAKKPTYLPALVAITQTSIVGPRKRRLSPRETARLQGLPDSYVFGAQPAAATYKQMGNGVNVGAVWHVMREHVKRDSDHLVATTEGQRIVEAVLNAPDRPNEILAAHKPASRDQAAKATA